MIVTGRILLNARRLAPDELDGSDKSYPGPQKAPPGPPCRDPPTDGVRYSLGGPTLSQTDDAIDSLLQGRERAVAADVNSLSCPAKSI